MAQVEPPDVVGESPPPLRLLNVFLWAFRMVILAAALVRWDLVSAIYVLVFLADILHFPLVSSPLSIFGRRSAVRSVGILVALVSSAVFGIVRIVYHSMEASTSVGDQDIWDLFGFEHISNVGEGFRQCIFEPLVLATGILAFMWRKKCAKELEKPCELRTERGLGVTTILALLFLIPAGFSQPSIIHILLAFIFLARVLSWMMAPASAFRQPMLLGNRGFVVLAYFVTAMLLVLEFAFQFTDGEGSDWAKDGIRAGLVLIDDETAYWPYYLSYFASVLLLLPLAALEQRAGLCEFVADVYSAHEGESMYSPPNANTNTNSARDAQVVDVKATEGGRQQVLQGALPSHPHRVPQGSRHNSSDDIEIRSYEREPDTPSPERLEDDDGSDHSSGSDSDSSTSDHDDDDNTDDAEEYRRMLKVHAKAKADEEAAAKAARFSAQRRLLAHYYVNRALRGGLGYGFVILALIVHAICVPSFLTLVSLLVALYMLLRHHVHTIYGAPSKLLPVMATYVSAVLMAQYVSYIYAVFEVQEPFLNRTSASDTPYERPAVTQLYGKAAELLGLRPVADPSWLLIVQAGIVLYLAMYHKITKTVVRRPMELASPRAQDGSQPSDGYRLKDPLLRSEEDQRQGSEQQHHGRGRADSMESVTAATSWLWILLAAVSKYSFVVVLVVLYILALSSVDLIQAGFVLFFIVFLVSPNLRRKCWPALVFYTMASTLTLFCWRVVAPVYAAEDAEDGIDGRDWAGLIGLDVGDRGATLWMVSFVSNIIILLFAVLQVPVYERESQGSYANIQRAMYIKQPRLAFASYYLLQAQLLLGPWAAYTVFICLTFITPISVMSLTTLVITLFMVFSNLWRGVAAVGVVREARSSLIGLFRIMALVQGVFVIALYIYQFDDVSEWFNDSVWVKEGLFTESELGLQRFRDEGFSDLYVFLLDRFALLLVAVVVQRALAKDNPEPVSREFIEGLQEERAAAQPPKQGGIQDEDPSDTTGLQTPGAYELRSARHTSDQPRVRRGELSQRIKSDRSGRERDDGSVQAESGSGHESEGSGEEEDGDADALGEYANQMNASQHPDEAYEPPRLKKLWKQFLRFLKEMLFAFVLLLFYHADKVTLITAFSVGAVAEDVMGASYMLVVLLHTVILIYRKDTDGCSCMKWLLCSCWRDPTRVKTRRPRSMSWGGGRHSSNDRLPAPSGTEREGLDAKTVSTSNPSTPHSTRTHRTIVADPLKQFGVHLTMKDERVLKAAQNMPELAGAVVRYNISTQSAELPRRPYRDSWLVLSVLSSAILLIKYFYQFHPFQYEEGRWFSGGTLSSQWWGFDRIDREEKIDGDFFGSPGSVIVRIINHSVDYSGVWSLLGGEVLVLFVCAVQRASHDLASFIERVEKKRFAQQVRCGVALALQLTGIVSVPRPVVEYEKQIINHQKERFALNLSHVIDPHNSMLSTGGMPSGNASMTEPTRHRNSGGAAAVSMDAMAPPPKTPLRRVSPDTSNSASGSGTDADPETMMLEDEEGRPLNRPVLLSPVTINVREDDEETGETVVAWRNKQKELAYGARHLVTFWDGLRGMSEKYTAQIYHTLALLALAVSACIHLDMFSVIQLGLLLLADLNMDKHGRRLRGPIWVFIIAVSIVILVSHALAAIDWIPSGQDVVDNVWPWTMDVDKRYWVSVGPAVRGKQVISDFIVLLLLSLTKRAWVLNSRRTAIASDVKRKSNADKSLIDAADADGELQVEDNSAVSKFLKGLYAAGRTGMGAIASAIPGSACKKEESTSRTSGSDRKDKEKKEKKAKKKAKKDNEFEESAVYAGHFIGSVVGRWWRMKREERAQQQAAEAPSTAQSFTAGGETRVTSMSESSSDDDDGATRSPVLSVVAHRSPGAPGSQPRTQPTTPGTARSGTSAPGAATGLKYSQAKLRQSRAQLAEAVATASAAAAAAASQGSMLRSIWDKIQLMFCKFSAKVLLVFIFIVSAAQQQQSILNAGYFVFSLVFLLHSDTLDKRGNQWWRWLRVFNLVILITQVAFQVPWVSPPDCSASSASCFSWHTIVGVQKYMAVIVPEAEPCTNTIATGGSTDADIPYGTRTVEANTNCPSPFDWNDGIVTSLVVLLLATLQSFVFRSPAFKKMRSFRDVEKRLASTRRRAARQLLQADLMQSRAKDMAERESMFARLRRTVARVSKWEALLYGASKQKKSQGESNLPSTSGVSQQGAVGGGLQAAVDLWPPPPPAVVYAEPMNERQLFVCWTPPPGYCLPTRSRAASYASVSRRNSLRRDNLAIPEDADAMLAAGRGPAASPPSNSNQNDSDDEFAELQPAEHLRYLVQYQKTGSKLLMGDYQRGPLTESGVHRVIIDGLEPNASYQVKISAISDAGAGMNSDPTPPTTQPAPVRPPAPIDLQSSDDEEGDEKKKKKKKKGPGIVSKIIGVLLMLNEKLQLLLVRLVDCTLYPSTTVVDLRRKALGQNVDLEEDVNKPVRPPRDADDDFHVDDNGQVTQVFHVPKTKEQIQEEEEAAAEAATASEAGTRISQMQKAHTFGELRGNLWITLLLIWRAAASHTEYIVYLAIVLNHCVYSSMLSMILIFVLWLYVLLEHPRAPAWTTMFALLYMVAVIVIKFIFQLSLFCFTIDSSFRWRYSMHPFDCDSFSPAILSAVQSVVQPVELVGVYKYGQVYGGDGFAEGVVWDLIVICALLLHRHTLKRKGLWNNRAQKVVDYEEAHRRKALARTQLAPVQEADIGARDSREEEMTAKQQQRRIVMLRDMAIAAGVDPDEVVAGRLVPQVNAAGDLHFVHPDVAVDPEVALQQYESVLKDRQPILSKGAAARRHEEPEQDDADLGDSAPESGSIQPMEAASAPSVLGSGTAHEQTPVIPIQASSHVDHVNSTTVLPPISAKPVEPGSGKRQSEAALVSLLHSTKARRRRKAEEDDGLTKAERKAAKKAETAEQKRWKKIRKAAKKDAAKRKKAKEKKNSLGMVAKVKNCLTLSCPCLPRSMWSPPPRDARRAKKRGQPPPQPPLPFLYRLAPAKVRATLRSLAQPPHVHASRPGQDLFLRTFLLQLVLFVYIILFYGKMTDKSGGELASELNTSQFNGAMVLSALTQLLVIVWDRVAHLKRSLKAKIVLHYCLVIVLHILIFFTVPLETNRTFNENSSLIIFYLLYTVYFMISAKQIRQGYRSTPPVNSLRSNGYDPPQSIIHAVYLAIPFLHELRVILDWVAAPTSMPLKFWWKLEAIEIDLFKAAVEMRNRAKNHEVISGQKRQPFGPKCVGILIFAILLFIIVMPALIFSTLNPTLETNPATSINFNLFIDGKSVTDRSGSGGTYRLYSSSTFQTLADVSGGEFNELITATAANGRPSPLIPDLTDATQKLLLLSYPARVWDISPPAITDLVSVLQNCSNPANAQTISLRLEMEYFRNAPATNKVVQTSYAKDITAEQCGVLAAAVQLVSSVAPPTNSTATPGTLSGVDIGDSIYIPSFYPPVLRLPADNDPIAISPSSKYAGVTLQLSGPSAGAKAGDNPLWWVLDVNSTFPLPSVEAAGAESGLAVYLVSDKVTPSFISSTLGASSIVALYLTVVLAVGRVIRGAFENPTHRIIYEEMQNTADLEELCEGIRVATRAKYPGHNKDEMQLYFILIKLFRSPEILIRVTKEKIL